MAQTQEDKKIAQINDARAAGLISPAEAKRLRQQVRENSNSKGNVDNEVGKAVNRATSPGSSGGSPAPSQDPGKYDDNTNPGRVDDPPGGEGDAGSGDGGGGGGDDDGSQGQAQIFPCEQMNGAAPAGKQWVGSYAINPDGSISNTCQLVDIEGYESEAEKREREAAERRNRETAEAYLTSLLTQFGLEELIPTVSDLIKTWGTADNIIISKLRQTEAYQKRFAGNALRTKNGYNAMSEAEYLSTEDAIKSTMRQYGLTADYYSRDKLATLIGGDVSATEVGDRVSQAKKVIDNADPNIKNSLVQMYGATMGDMLGYVLAPETALETLQRRVNAGFASGVALGQGIAMDTSLSEQIGDLTMGDERTLRAQFANIGDSARSTKRLANIDSEDVTDTDVVKSSFGLDSTADTKIRKLQSRERARFSGQSSTGRSTLAGGGI